MANETQIILNYEQIIGAIGEELQNVWRDLKNLSGDENAEIVKIISNIKSIEISDEQSYVKKRDKTSLDQGTVYIVVRFGSGSINFSSSVTPISLYCVGTANKVKPTQLLLGTFASVWTTKNLSQGLQTTIESISKNILQVWNTPEVVTNFNEVYADFKNLFRLSGLIVLGPAAIRVGTLTYYYMDGLTEKSETINIMSLQDNYHASLDAQPFGNTNGFVKSEVDFSTYAFSISTYLLSNQLSKDMLAIRGFRYRPSGTYSGTTSKFQPNDTVKLKIDLTNEYNNMPGSGETTSNDDPVKGSNFYSLFKVVDSKIGQELAGLPTLTISFTR